MCRKKYKNKLCFWRFDNNLFLAISVVCIIVWSCIYFTEWFELDEIASSLVSGILSAALIPLGLNYGKYIKEKKRVKVICKSIVDLAVFLVINLNTHLIKSNCPMLENADELSCTKIEHLKFEKFNTDNDVFVLVGAKLSQLTQMEYFDTTDSFVYAVEKTTASINKLIVGEKSLQLYRELCTVLKVIGAIKPPLCETNYAEIFNEKVETNNNALKNNFNSYTEDYIVNCIENDLSEKMHK